MDLIELFITLLLILSILILLILSPQFPYFLSQIIDSGIVGPTTIAASIQAVATVILVVITWRYAEYTRVSTNLLRQQFESEANIQHAKVLKERVEKLQNELPSEDELRIYNLGKESPREMFQVSDELGGDPFFLDLKRNHVQDIEKYLRDLDSEYIEYCELRDKFRTKVEIPELPDDEVKPEIYTENYTKWMFECALLVAMNEKSVDELSQHLLKCLTENHSDNGREVYLRADKASPDGEIIRYSIPSTSHSKKQIRDIAETFWVVISGEMRENISSENFDLAQQASELFKSIHGNMKELHTLLNISAKYPIFPGECEIIYDTPKKLKATD